MNKPSRILFANLVLALVAPAASAQALQTAFEEFFTPQTMRVDYFHTGGMAKEILSLDEVVGDGPWPGSRTRLLDSLGLGKYSFEVRDLKSDRLIYSRGFASVFGEWETTDEESSAHRTFHESLRFPWPKQPVRVTLRKREEVKARRIEISSEGAEAKTPQTIDVNSEQPSAASEPLKTSTAGR